MRKEHGNFLYYGDHHSIGKSGDFVADISTSIRESTALFRELFEKVELPGYFGFNWNALSDCLRDLSWIKEHRVVLLHHDLPQIPVEELRIYLEVLTECSSSWNPGEEHELLVAFPKDCKVIVCKILGTAS